MTPWRELDRVSQRLFNRLNGGNDGDLARGAWVPPVSVEETQDELLLTVELPGLAPEQVELHVENNVLTIRGEKREERSEDGAKRRYHRWERSYGSFTRAFALPRTVSVERISAEFENGLLRVRVPKVAEAKSRRIPIAGVAAANGTAG
jgi:HSP20 family protein